MHVLIPHAASQAEAAQALWPTLQLPNLTALLAGLEPVDTRVNADIQAHASNDVCALSAPHEPELARLLGLPADDGRIPWAAWRRWRQTGEADDQAWAELTLCHWQVTTQQVLLQHPGTLALTPTEDQALLQTLRDFFRDDGLDLLPGDRPGHWLARGELLRHLRCAALDRLLGEQVDAELLGRDLEPAARSLRRLQNETQMLLYTHAVNEAREQQRQSPVNGFVLTGAGAWQPTPGWQPPELRHAFGSDELRPPALGTVLQIDTLREAALRQDWPAWARAWLALDAQLGTPAWRAAARQPGFTLSLSGDTRSQRWQASARRGGFGISAWWQRLRPRARLTATAATIGAL